MSYITSGMRDKEFMGGSVFFVRGVPKIAESD